MNDNHGNPTETPKEWLRYAEGELGVAQREMESPSPVYHTVCFLCQSAAEKFLKGFLISRGWTLEKTHDIMELLAWCAEHDDELGGMVNQGAVLNEYIVAGRYPGDIAFDPIGEAEAMEALVAVQKIRERVQHIMERA